MFYKICLLLVAALFLAAGCDIGDRRLPDNYRLPKSPEPVVYDDDDDPRDRRPRATENEPARPSQRRPVSSSRSSRTQEPDRTPNRPVYPEIREQKAPIEDYDDGETWRYEEPRSSSGSGSSRRR